MSEQPDIFPPSDEDENYVEELFLLHLRFKEAQVIEVGANKPILLNDPETAWIVYSGHVDIFAVRLEGGMVAGSRHHLVRVSPGQAFFGVDPALNNNSIGLLAVGGNETQLFKLEARRLRQMGQEEEYRVQILALLDRWIYRLSNILTTTLPPKACIRLSPGEVLQLEEGESACAARDLLWITHEVGSSRFIGDPYLPALNHGGRWPLTNRTWLEVVEKSTLQAITTENLLTDDPAWSFLGRFHQLVLNEVNLKLEETSKEERERLIAKSQVNQAVVEDALNYLAASLAPEEESFQTAEEAEPLLQACRLIAENQGFTVQVPARLNTQNPLQDLARASRVQYRQVGLKGKWWQKDNGPLLGYLATDQESNQPVVVTMDSSKHPIVLLPKSPKKYELHDPIARTRVIVTEKVAETVGPFAFMFYRPFPDQPLSALDLIKYALKSYDVRDLRTIVLAGSAVSLLGLLIPLAVRLIFDTIIPNAERAQLLQLGVALFVLTLNIALFQIIQNIATLRLQGKLGPSFQAAAWDRLLKLPVSFFRNYSAGELASRIMGINTIQRTLSGTAIKAILSGVFSIYTFILLFYFHRQLALAATGLVLISVLATVFAGQRKIKYQRLFTDIRSRLSGKILQVFTGVAKFRAAGAEARSFAFWARDFSQLKQTAYKARNIDNSLLVFNSGYNVLATAVLYGLFVIATEDAALTTGTFLAFLAAFVQLLGSMLMLSSAFITILGIVPLYEMVQPILRSLPEVDALKESPGELNGGIEVSNVSFRYRDDSPLILKDVSLEINPGEFVALVGPSGSGKTTLFRLLLGFETPFAGTIYFDGHDLAGLDTREVRQQIGVVLQNSRLMPGSIYENIVGATLLSRDVAKEAAQNVGLAEDIDTMPMGMETFVTEDGGTLSGGQRQRILIARAIVARPRILFFDEATSALDNRTQAIVSQSLENLQSTRIVIAHRLSTIMNADRIYVLQDGVLVQSGTYDELIKQPGAFSELAQRQLA